MQVQALAAQVPCPEHLVDSQKEQWSQGSSVAGRGREALVMAAVHTAGVVGNVPVALTSLQVTPRVRTPPHCWEQKPHGWVSNVTDTQGLVLQVWLVGGLEAWRLTA